MCVFRLHLWLGSIVVRGTSGCEAADPVAWLEKRRCAINRGRKASCSLTTLGMLIESSGKVKDEEEERTQILAEKNTRGESVKG